MLFHNENKLEEVRMGLNLVEGDEYKETLAAISEVVADVLVKTLGPYASTTTIDDGVFTYPTKDGWSVLNRLRFGDAVQETLFKFIKQISFTLNSHVGDGTTTAVIAANHFTKQLETAIHSLRMSGRLIRQADLLDVIDNCKDKLIEELHHPDRLHKVVKGENGYEDIYKIAYVSSNRNETIAKTIKEIYDKTDNPNIHVTLNSNSNVTYGEVQRGYKLDGKLLMAECYVNSEDKTCIITDDTIVHIFDHNVTYSEHFTIISQLITRANKLKQTLVIIAPYYDEVISTILQSTIKQCANRGQMPSTMCVQVPITLKAQKEYLDDFSVLVGAEIFKYSYVRMYNQMLKQYNAKLKGETIDDEFDEYKGLLENSNFESPDDIVNLCTGIAHKITLSEKMVLLENFSTDTNRYQARKEEIYSAFDAVNSKMNRAIDPLDKEYMDAHMRYVKFLGDTGVIHVGGDSELARHCTKDSIDDAVLACRSAFENGYIRGLNIETISAATKLWLNSDEGSYEQIVYRIFKDTFTLTSLDVMGNKYTGEADYDDESQVWSWEGEKVSAYSVILNCVTHNKCFDIVTEKFEDAGESLVNSVATDCEIISAMSSIMSLLLSSNQLLSINRGYDRKRSKAKVLSEESDKAQAWAEGIAKGLRYNDCTLFEKPSYEYAFEEPDEDEDEEDSKPD